MPVWGALAATLTLNVARHLRGKSTLCSSARRVLPAPAFVFGWGVLSGFLIPHFCRKVRP